MIPITPERNVAYRIEELPDEICDAHVDYLERRRLNSREEFGAAEEHDCRYSERNGHEQQIRAELSQVCAGLVNKGSHQRVVERVPDTHNGYHRCNSSLGYAENGYKEERQLHTDHVVADDLTAVCHAVEHSFFYSSIPFFFQPFVVGQFDFLLRAPRGANSFVFILRFRIRL